MWKLAFNFFLALLIFSFNLLVLVGISSDGRLHTTTHLLSTNLWLCNCITAIVTIFFSLTPSVVPCQTPGHDNYQGSENVNVQSAAVLINSTVSLLTLLAIGIVHALSRHNYHLSRLQSSRLLLCTWVCVLFLLLTDFFLLRLAHSFDIVVTFHLALLFVFILLNIIVHTTNLVMLSQCRNRQDRFHAKLFEECATSSLWLLLNSLSFVVVAIMMVWDANSEKSAKHALMGIEMTAYSVHCFANPLIAVIRERSLEESMTSLLFRNKRLTTQEDLVMSLMRDPPPPYSI